MSANELAPWNDEQAQHWLASLNSWSKMARLIQMTLNQDPAKYPHQIRAAAALVIMFGREHVWPDRADVIPLDDMIGLARRQLSQVKHQFSIRARINPDLKQNPKFRLLLDSVDQEIKILESRMSEEPMNMPNEPPSTWNNFWCDS
jgi:hypothetical protein